MVGGVISIDAQNRLAYISEILVGGGLALIIAYHWA